MRDNKELEKLQSLGSSVEYGFEYDKNKLEKIDNQFPNSDCMISLDAYEFTTVCPKTGQPDFAKLYINYVPDKFLVESKSLKLYLFSFRNVGAFHEDVVNIIMNDLVNLLSPKYIEVVGIFAPRGGIAIYPFASYAKIGGGYEDYKKSRQFEMLNSIMGGKINFRN